MLTATGIALAVAGKLEVAAIGLADTLFKIAIDVFHKRTRNKTGYPGARFPSA